ncbi:bifunctional UDP-3-O-[3-hydroxymyristoyl] N-acetylglucosamine deacetylase/3-hydroxyacyl-ACP dehydratase [Ichthyobacterium seriolicida]|uniref:Multifunctional fusion protein n=1 Tax=Ichthyobacterium seriolicida TaxID=242600 RepID=A0A1J1E4H1_9FLAO|nr:bifunctional UDP-3-O-[3-hydroxymyristoyl] N-acetylglucosamine deacetylase/3-hydroxyacyl-ACP dehydratase [Ichthyobacterium seriolicida]BAV94948.1 hydroxymyristoyl-ACP dehydratase [Ichthyobacterium seriolicida]
MIQKQRTIQNEVSFVGVGLHTGNDVSIKFKPGGENTGIVFRRVDLDGAPEVEAISKFAVSSSTSRSTILDKYGVKIRTTEHVLAAIAALEIDNLIIEIDSEEIPIADGSSKPFIDLLEKANVVQQEQDVDFYYVKDSISFLDEDSGAEILVLPSNDYRVSVMVDFQTKVLGTQNASVNSMEEFKNECSDSRTFCFLHEIEHLIDGDLIKGGGLDNSVVYVDKEPCKEILDKLKEVFGNVEVSVESNGILNNTELRHHNEAARHKLLDLVGDLALIGKKIKGHVIATKPGHLLNINFAKKISKEIEIERKGAPRVNPCDTPVMDIGDIMKFLPHRPPFLLIDKVLELSDKHVIGLKNVTINEYFFKGHFPGEPVMPGVLQIEAMAQVGGLLVLSTVLDPENYLTYFMKIDKAKFKKKVVPGDTVIYKLELLAPIRRGICHMFGTGYVGKDLVVEAEMVAKISKVK